MGSMDKQPTPGAGKGDNGPDDKGRGLETSPAKIPAPKKHGD